MAANSLLVSLLMPEKAVEIVMKSTVPWDTIAVVSKVFDVSKEAAGYRLVELGYISILSA